MKTPNYQVDLNAHLADCEMNYLRLQKLLPDALQAGDELCIGVGNHALNIRVRECAPYTACNASQWQQRLPSHLSPWHCPYSCAHSR